MKVLLFIVSLLASASVFANIPVHNLKHTTLMTKDSMFVLDKRAGNFWKVETSCELPIQPNSKIRFVSNSRVIKEGTQITFMIDTLKNKHKCDIQKVSRF